MNIPRSGNMLQDLYDDELDDEMRQERLEDEFDRADLLEDR